MTLHVNDFAITRWQPMKVTLMQLLLQKVVKATLHDMAKSSVMTH